MGQRSASRTWSVKLYFVTFLASFQSSTRLYYVVRIPRMILQPGFAGISVQQRSTGFLNICKFSKFSLCGHAALFHAVLIAILCGSESWTVRKPWILDQGHQGSNLPWLNTIFCVVWLMSVNVRILIVAPCGSLCNSCSSVKACLRFQNWVTWSIFGSRGLIWSLGHVGVWLCLFCADLNA